MAILSVSSPSTAKHSGIKDVVYEFESDKQQLNGLTESVSSVSNASGFVRFNLTGTNSGIEVNDVITGSNFSDDDLNVRGKVTAQTTTTITTDIPYVGISSGSGTLTLTNDNFKLKLELRDAGVNIVHTAFVQPDSSDIFTFDISGSLKSLLSNDLGVFGGSNVGKWVDPDSAFTYTLKLYEIWDGVESGTIEGLTLIKSSISGSSMVAYNIAIQDDQDFSDFLMQTTLGSTRQFLTTNKRLFIDSSNDEYNLHFLSDEANVEMVINRYTNSAGFPTFYSSVVVTLGRGYCPLNSNTLLFTADTIRWDVYLRRASDNVVISETIDIIPLNNIKCNNNYRVNWINKLGGEDFYNFREEVQTNTPDKSIYFDDDNVNSITFENKKELNLTGEQESNRVLEWLSGLYSSDEVYLLDGTDRIKKAVIGNTYTTRQREALQPTVRLRENNDVLI